MAHWSAPVFIEPSAPLAIGLKSADLVRLPSFREKYGLHVSVLQETLILHCKSKDTMLIRAGKCERARTLQLRCSNYHQRRGHRCYCMIKFEQNSEGIWYAIEKLTNRAYFRVQGHCEMRYNTSQSMQIGV